MGGQLTTYLATFRWPNTLAKYKIYWANKVEVRIADRTKEAVKLKMGVRPTESRR